MENTSKAIIIAGEILIGILVLSILAYVINLFGNFSKKQHDKMSESEVTSFNVNFTNYSGKADISMQDIVTLINFANKHNKNYEAKPGDNYYVDVCIGTESVLNYDMTKLLDKYNGDYFYFSCNLNIEKIVESKQKEKTIEVKGSRKDERNDADIVLDEGSNMVSKIVFTEVKNQVVKLADGTTIPYYEAIMQNYNIDYNTVR